MKKAMKKNKAKTNRQMWSREVIEYLTDMGYGKETAKYEVGVWVEGGFAALSDTPKRDIKEAMMQLGLANYSQSYSHDHQD